MKFFLLLVLLLTVTACPQDNEINIIDSLFNSAGIKGTFVLYDLNAGRYTCNDTARANTGFLPASTFKIFNSLAALEAGAVKDEEEIVKWDSISRNYDAWNKDHNMRSAIKYSVVWFYQEMARRIGAERMQDYLDKTGYGNRDISAGIDLFWLEGNFKITPVEQIAFLKKLYSNDLPFSQRNMDIVKDIMIKKKSGDYVIRAKTGWAGRTTPQTGWYVGWVEKKDNAWFFAMNMEINKDEDASKREELTYDILKTLKITEE